MTLDSLTETGLERYGPGVFRSADLAGRISDLELRFGLAILSIDDYPEHGRATLWNGTFEATDTHVTFTFPELGTSTFRYKLQQDGGLKRLRLMFVSAEGPDTYGAPVEVFLRMALTSYSFAWQDGP